jgi:hypothetical protein
MSIEYYEDLLRPHFEGRKFILIGGPVVGFGDMIRQLRALGAERPLIIGSTLGTGGPPSEEDAFWCSLGVRGRDAMDGFYRHEALLRDLPGEIRERVDRYDPERSARALGAIVLTDVSEVAGRPRYGGRPPHWAALEDKVGEDAESAAGSRPSDRGTPQACRTERAALPADSP